MRLDKGRTVSNLICLTSLLVCASAPLAAQSGVDLLDPEQVRRALESPGQSDGAVTVRAVLAEAPGGVVQATHERDTLQYDDNGFENFENDTAGLEPSTTFRSGLVEWAQRFEVEHDSALVSVRVCFRRPDGDLSRSLDFNLRFYGDSVVNNVNNPGRRSGLLYVIETDISRAGRNRCVILSDHLAGKTLNEGVHWVSVEWNTDTQKRLGGDHYTSEDEARTDRSGNVVHDTEVRWRQVQEGAPAAEWTNARSVVGAGQTMSGLKAIGVSLVVERVHPPDPGPGPGPDPGPDPGPAPDSACSDGLCLLENDRFRVRARYAMPGMAGESAGTVAAGLGGAAGLFTFGGDHPELLVRLVDDCSGSGYYGLYAGAATDADYSIAVRDTMTNDLKWFRGLGGASIRDAMAFTCNN